MRIIFTGASSFTGLNFVKALAEAGHDVFCTFQKDVLEYKGLRAERVARASEVSQPLFGISFGDKRFMEVLAGDGPWDLLCHHAADVTDYKSTAFDWQTAIIRNTYNLPAVLDELVRHGCHRVVLTGSVFENDEGEGAGNNEAFSPYGLSKALTAQVFRYETQRRELAFGKFVIPNPFGPFEDPRFTAYLLRTWKQGEVPVVNTPEYIRDNIHVSLLAKAYCNFVNETIDKPEIYSKMNPSGYVESQGEFALRFAREMAPRLGMKCEVILAKQVHFEEPRVRINTDSLNIEALNWIESEAWDQLADFYR